MNWEDKLKEFHLLDGSLTKCEDEIIKFVQRLLKEQRQLCKTEVLSFFQKYKYKYTGTICSIIENTKEPKGDL